MHTLRAFYCHEPIIECMLCEHSIVMNHKEMEDRKTEDLRVLRFLTQCARRRTFLTGESPESTR